MTDLNTVLKKRAWLRREMPFPHVVARNVFIPEFFKSLNEQYKSILNKGLAERDQDYGRLRRIPGYDAFGGSFGRKLPEPLSIFTSEAWHDLLAGLFRVPATGHINGGYHYHAPGSANGFIHTDFNPVWFLARYPRRIKFTRERLCSYKHGHGPLPPEEKVQVVRAVAMIFYIANDGWAEGDGGETGIFSSSASIDAPVTKVAPLNNSILVFECTPNSYHSFLHNPTRPRNSVIMWVHRPMEDAMSRWSERELERWKT